VIKRKPILLVDESHDSLKAVDLFKRSGIEYVEYNIRKFEESCCGGSGDDDMPTTKAPSLFAVEGVFKGLEKINEYILSLKSEDDAAASSSSNSQSESSAYW
jgi:hypothetical protein